MLLLHPEVRGQGNAVPLECSAILKFRLGEADTEKEQDIEEDLGGLV